MQLLVPVPGMLPPKSGQPTVGGGGMSLQQLEDMLGAPASEPPACQPYDDAAYLNRLGSFRAGPNWFDKPSPVSPPVCEMVVQKQAVLA